MKIIIYYNITKFNSDRFISKNLQYYILLYFTELTDTLLTAQAVVFFVAGFETSSSTMAFSLYELAQNQEIQDKLRQEIRKMDEKNNGVLTYTDIKEMKYLDKVFKGNFKVLNLSERKRLKKIFLSKFYSH